MVGDIITIDGVEYEVLWSGGEGLIPSRVTKITGFWTPPKRIYNKTGKHIKDSATRMIEKHKRSLEKLVDIVEPVNQDGEVENG